MKTIEDEISEAKSDLLEAIIKSGFQCNIDKVKELLKPKHQNVISNFELFYDNIILNE